MTHTIQENGLEGIFEVYQSEGKIGLGKGHICSGDVPKWDGDPHKHKPFHPVDGTIIGIETVYFDSIVRGGLGEPHIEGTLPEGAKGILFLPPKDFRDAETTEKGTEFTGIVYALNLPNDASKDTYNLASKALQGDPRGPF
jgi:hypothetical protein